MAWRPDGQGLTYLEQEPAPAGRPGLVGADGAGQARLRQAQGRPRRTGDSANAEQGRGARAPERKDRLYQWLPPFDEASKKVIFESNTRMTGVRFSPDMKMIFFSERAGQNTVEYAVALAEPAQRYTLARYAARRRLRESRQPRRHALDGRRWWPRRRRRSRRRWRRRRTGAALGRRRQRVPVPARPTTRIPTRSVRRPSSTRSRSRRARSSASTRATTRTSFERVSSALDIESRPLHHRSRGTRRKSRSSTWCRTARARSSRRTRTTRPTSPTPSSSASPSNALTASSSARP